MNQSTIEALEERFIDPSGTKYDTIGITHAELQLVIAEARLKERGALDRLYAAAQPFTKAWWLRSQKSPQTSGNEKRRKRDLESGFYSVADQDGERFLLTGHDLKRLADAIAEIHWPSRQADTTQ